MSDSSSPCSSASDSGGCSSPTIAGGLAFLVHSPETVQRNLPPDVDNKPLARQKRRRTSKEDEDILKAEYQRNPKPDKAARLEIVRRVALGEKEVQIWFQNKRQNDRRRSRPAQSYEILPHSSSSFDEPTSTAVMSSFLSDTGAQGDDAQEHDNEGNALTTTSSQIASVASETSLSKSTIDTANFAAHTNVQLLPTPQSTAKTDSQITEVFPYPSTDSHSCDTAPIELGSSQPLPSSQDSTQPAGLRPGYLANRRSASYIRLNEEELPSSITNAPAEPVQQPSRSMKRSHSFIRLSMTVDGKARVITDADQSPSPPRSQPPPGRFTGRTAGLHRSYSAAGLNERLKEAASQEPSPKFARTSIGRSRDSRAWEFWCDSDARNSLSEKADQERSGSAADAIGLIRANSRGTLRSNSNKRNAQLLMRQDSTKRCKDDGLKSPRPGLVRASTSYGRLQTKPPDTVSTPDKGKGNDNDSDFEVPQTESDKENWEPEDQHQGSRRSRVVEPHTTGQQRQRQILGENTHILSQSSSLGAMMAREKQQQASGKKQVTNTESFNPEEDDEIATFMSNRGANSGRTSISSGEELGCVEGLLALSQGNWR